jgi:hypothetical protein
MPGLLAGIFAVFVPAGGWLCDQQWFPSRALVTILRARPHWRFAPPLIRFIPDLRTYSVPLLFSEAAMRPNPRSLPSR